jgi:hypothetical protein
MRKILLTLICFVSWFSVQARAEDCISLNYRFAEVKQIGSWKLVQGEREIFDFGGEKQEALKALDVIKANRVMKSCVVGHPVAVFKYLLSIDDIAPGVKLANEKCMAFTNHRLQVVHMRSDGSLRLFSGNQELLNFGKNTTDANAAMAAMRRYKFNQHCYIGSSFDYWKKA